VKRVAGCAGVNVRVVIYLGLYGESQLRGLVRAAGSCLDLEAFRKAIARR